MECVRYLSAIEKLREEFAEKLNIARHTEAYKIWARWIITHRSLFQQKTFFLPTDDLINDSQIIVEMVSKGVAIDDANDIYHWLMLKTKIINDIPVLSTLPEVSYDGNILKDGSERFAHQMVNNGIILQKMQKSCTHEDPLAASWFCYTLYQLLEGKGLQWAVPKKVMRAFEYCFNCDTELFASPINNYFDNYYSLFEIDKFFGSKGNFFATTSKDFVEGSFQVNPPFIDPLFSKLTNRVLRYLDVADRANKQLTFIYVMPEWTDCDGYDKLVESRYCSKLIRLPKNYHSYYQYDTNSYIRARFTTVILIMSTNLNICTFEMEKDIKRGFINSVELH
jgi:hypothetical protein